VIVIAASLMAALGNLRVYATLRDFVQKDSQSRTCAQHGDGTEFRPAHQRTKRLDQRVDATPQRPNAAEGQAHCREILQRLL
jgi:hypothetical protein